MSRRLSPARVFPALALFALASLSVVATSHAEDQASPLSLSTFLDRLVRLDDLPQPVEGKTLMTSTWDRKGGNQDGDDFKRIEGDRNILFDEDGPGCVHRIFTGRLYRAVAGTRIRVFLDRAEKPVFDMPVNEFFNDHGGPFPYPLVFHKTYPGMLFPIPFAKHCRIELYHPQARNWGNYWQVTYTRYAAGTKAETLRWPLSEPDQKAVERTCRAWLAGESTPPAAPAQWSVNKTATLKPKTSQSVELSGGGVIRQIRLHASPSTPEALKNVRMQFSWDGDKPAVDMPIGYFFGNIATGYQDRFCSIPMGVADDYSYCCFPMPFSRGAKLVFVNEGKADVTLRLDLAVDKVDPSKADTIPPGRLNASLRETEILAKWANRDKLVKMGPKDRPVHEVLNLQGSRGKYVGVFLHVDWPIEAWWGEGDWLIWTDEKDWPPSYHGTGSEEYFNSGWCEFDNKAISGIIREPIMRPGQVGVYSFHLNDAFPFRDNATVAVEMWPGIASRDDMPHAFWRSSAYWYAFPSR